MNKVFIGCFMLPAVIMAAFQLKSPTSIPGPQSKDLREALGKWEFIASESTLGFKIDNMWWSSVSGTVGGMKGSAHIKEGITSSELNFSLDANSFKTGIKTRDEHLKGKDFFDVPVYPVIQFKGNSIAEVNKEKRYVLKGDLTIKGKTKPIEVPFDFAGIENNKAVFQGEALVNKKDFNLDEFKGMGTGDAATVTFTVKAKRAE